MDLSIIIPCYNEDKNVSIIHDAINKIFYNKKFTYEMIFVNDGSKDNTEVELKKLVKNSKSNIKVINFSRNFGKEAAMYAGLKESSGEYVSIIDADMQQNPSLILKMLGILEKDDSYDSVATYQAKRKEGIVLGSLKRSFYRIINKFTEIEFVNGASDFRVFRRRMVDAILSMQEYNRFSKGIFSWVGFNTYYMPYVPSKRENGVSKWSFLKLFNYAIDGIVAFTTKPLRFATKFGLLSLILSFIYLIIILVQRIFFNMIISNFSFLISVIIIFSSIQLISIGIVGEYIAKIYMESKKRPIYIAKEVITNSHKK